MSVGGIAQARRRVILAAVQQYGTHAGLAVGLEQLMPNAELIGVTVSRSVADQLPKVAALQQAVANSLELEAKAGIQAAKASVAIAEALIEGKPYDLEAEIQNLQLHRPLLRKAQTPFCPRLYRLCDHVMIFLLGPIACYRVCWENILCFPVFLFSCFPG